MSAAFTNDPPVLSHVISEHILSHLATRRSSPSLSAARPVFIGLQGPQGSGKSTVVRAVQQTLSSSPHELSVVVLSLDDLYLPHDGLLDVARKHPGNWLLRGRGLPGTHDVSLGKEVLDGLFSINHSKGRMELPSFDKSLFGGEGDRTPAGSGVVAPVDVVILEGWCMGFYPVEEDELARRYEATVGSSASPSGGGEPNARAPDIHSILQNVSLEDLRVVNGYLKDYPESLYPYFSLFVQVQPPINNPYGPIYTWRLQQEHHMKSLNGGIGMTDEQVKGFIDRYIPGYMFFSEGIERGYYNTSEAPRDVRVGPGAARNPPWKGSLLRVTIHEDRVVTQIESM